jgi:hypothetical protein
MKKTMLFFATLFMACGNSAHAANVDELWEITNSMEMQGMSIPASTQNSCIAKNQPYKPEPEDKNCSVSDVRVSGNRTTWKMKCTGKDAMEGTGDMTKTASTLKGVMTMKTQGEQMTMKMSGRIIGKCDYAAEQKKLNAMVANAQAQQADALAQSKELQRKSCEDARKSASSNFSSYESYKQSEGNPGMNAYLGKCKLDLEASRKQLCAKATVQEHEYAKKYCPDEYAAMKLQHCTGRSNSFRDLCDGASGSSAMEVTGTGSNPATSILEGAKGLINIFGF